MGPELDEFARLIRETLNDDNPSRVDENPFATGDQRLLVGGRVDFDDATVVPIRTVQIYGVRIANVEFTLGIHGDSHGTTEVAALGHSRLLSGECIYINYSADAKVSVRG